MNNASNLLVWEKFEFPLPYNFDQKNPEFDIFKNTQPENYHNSIIETYQNVKIATNSVIYDYFNIIRESCISELAYQKYQKGLTGTH